MTIVLTEEPMAALPEYAAIRGVLVAADVDVVFLARGATLVRRIGVMLRTPKGGSR